MKLMNYETGTLLFGVEGATAAIRGNLDFFGVMVLAFATASRVGSSATC
jgi:uncharacterized membrane protein YeiH